MCFGCFFSGQVGEQKRQLKRENLAHWRRRVANIVNSEGRSVRIEDWGMKIGIAYQFDRVKIDQRYMIDIREAKNTMSSNALAVFRRRQVNRRVSIVSTMSLLHLRI